MKSNTISIIIPTWNRATTIEKAVQSSLNQTFLPLEILVCDDGSTDNTKEIVESIKNPIVKFIPGEHSGRPATPRNRGIKVARGEWIAFLDSDDEWLPKKLEMQMKILQKTGLKACSTNALRIIPNKKTWFWQSLLRWKSSRITFKDLKKHGNQIVCSSALVQKSLFDQVEGFPEEKNLTAIEDFALWLRISHLTDFAYLRKPFVKYKDDPKHSVRKNSPSQKEIDNLVSRDFENWLTSPQRHNRLISPE
jgi:glycosyltransferase involved in cell wall biosynthesis